MNQDISLMIKIYKTYEYDWMGFEIKDPSELTRHHIVKREDGGENNISNYALLTKYAHRLLHYLEEHYNKEYNYLNEKFLELNRSVSPPTIEYYEDINRVMKSIKKRIKNKNRLLRRKK